MKSRIILFVLFIFSLSTLSAQITSFFDRHQDDTEVEYIELTKEQLVAELKSDINKQNTITRLTENLDRVQAIISRKDAKLLFDEAYKLTKSDSYESLINIRSKGERVLGYVLEDDGIIVEWLLLVKSQEEVVVGRVMGEFKMSDFTEILSSFGVMGSCTKNDRSDEAVDVNLEIETKPKIDILDFNVYPNPLQSGQPFTVSFKNTVALANAQIVIHDLSGKRLLSHPLSKLNEGPQQISINNNSSSLNGSIVVSLIRDEEVLSELLIVH